VSGTTDLSGAVTDADLVMEAVPEDMDIKRETFQDVEPHVDGECILATNTSSLSVTKIAAALDSPSRAIGLHFFNPAHIMNLVEVVEAEQTAAGVQRAGVEFVDSLGKTAVEVHDSPGFASSRLGVVLGAEAVRMIETDVADPADIDAAMKLGYNHPMGPIELTDVVGLDVRLGVLEYLREELGERFRPPQLLKQKVRAGKLGKKSGEGFYVWENGEPVSASDRTGE
jgi:3-hydroxyacyl-CoA dehydrogenase